MKCIQLNRRQAGCFIKRIKHLFIVFCFTTGHALAQEQSSNKGVSGVIQDSVLRSPVEYATIAVVTSAPGKIIITVQADKAGNFRIENITAGNYSIIISATGYANKTLLGITVNKDSSIDLGKILLSRNAAQLKEVVVNASKPLVRQEVDRIIYDVEADPDSKVGNLWLLLPKIPLISIDADDKLRVNGGKSFKVLLNGRRSALVAGKPEDVFKMLPANSIERIEVFTIPPAKYDGEGLNGLINVVMKKNTGQKYIGSLNTAYSPRFSIASGFFTGKVDRFAFSTTVGGSWERAPLAEFHGIFENLTASPYSLFQNGDKKYKGTSTEVNLQADYELDSLQLLTASAGIRVAKRHDFTNQYTSKYNQDENLISSYTNSLMSDFNDKEINFGLNYEAISRRNKNQALTMSYNYSYSPSEQNNTNRIQELYNYPSGRLQQFNKTFTREQTFQADYVYPLGALNIAGGAKMIVRDNNADYTTAYYDSLLDRFITDSLGTSGFEYKQRIYSLYNSYLLKAKKWALSAGMRFEMTSINASFTNAGKTVDQWYSNPIPTLSIQRPTGKFSNINIGYSHRILRPAIWQLNSFVNQVDPAFYTTGNTDLKPVTNHIITTSYSWFKKGYIKTGLDYSFATNTIQKVTTFVNDSISYTSYQNIGKNKMLGLNVSLRYPFSKRVSVSLNSLASYVWMSGTIMNKLYNNNGIQGNAFFYVSYSINKTWRTAANAGYFSPTVILQGQSNGFFLSTLTVYKTALKNKLTISASVTNPYQQYRTSQNKLTTSAFIQDYSYLRFSRNFNINLVYNFGKLKTDVKKVKRGIQNDDTSTKKTDSEKGAQ